ncbi:alpha/beta hydrolase [soil metagenome]
MTTLWNRRILLGAAAATSVGVVSAARAQAGSTPPPQSWPAAGPDLSGSPSAPVVIPAPPEPRGLLSDAGFPLWPEGKVPGGAGVAVERLVLERGSPAGHDRAIMHVTQPIIEIFRPANPNGAAVIVAPGGGYVRLAIDKEGAGAARRLNQCGVTAFVLNYRLPGDGWAAEYDAPLQDIQRAIRVVRARAADWSLDVRRIGVMGFSAGGHLAAAALTRHGDVVYDAVDAADAISARPDFGCLGYAVMSVGSGPGQYPGPDTEARQPLDARVRPGMAPTFIVHAADDRTVPVANSLAMFSALKAAGVPVEMHIYQEGGHGFGFNLPEDRPASQWPEAFEAWARRSGFLG